jgi:hypothetical protein
VSSQLKVRSNHKKLAGRSTAAKAKQAGWESVCFELDRSAFTGLVQELLRVIRLGADEMKMSADERAFGESLSQPLRRIARKLEMIAGDLNFLLRSVARAKLPIQLERPEPRHSSVGAHGTHRSHN